MGNFSPVVLSTAFVVRPQQIPIDTASGLRRGIGVANDARPALFVFSRGLAFNDKITIGIRNSFINQTSLINIVVAV